MKSYRVFKEDSKTSKTTEATKEIRNNTADGHEMYTDLKCTAHGLAMMSFVSGPALNCPYIIVNNCIYTG